ncbi:hypothetical protein SKAU_G00097200 [Synaphobranchus kaupii]|uniref:SGNH hydrolase-type esterase domain-containing protein n=1 Tax=Synaphobranchus kaupii TaxID=118154 RepID=A0A9Q1J609_SYNKA|nr:hypothetical protein SKAU_G00097200 [Synaphobranchus kaupii]
MRDSLSLLEVELTEMEEQVLTHITISTDSQLLKDQLSRHIIIHTGTNDLRAEQKRVGSRVRRVAERATETFPNAKITISSLLPRKDFHSLTIQRVNAEISRGCALLPNVHLAHHPTIGPWDLYDHVHLDKAAVREFAKTQAISRPREMC